MTVRDWRLKSHTREVRAETPPKEVLAKFAFLERQVMELAEIVIRHDGDVEALRATIEQFSREVLEGHSP